MENIIKIIILAILNIGYFIKNRIYFKKILPSISDSYYEYQKREEGFIFILYIWFNVIGFLLVSPNILFTISIFILLLVSMNPLFKKEKNKSKIFSFLHFFGAIVGIGTALVSFIIFHSIYFPLIITLICIILYKGKARVHFIELIAITQILIALIYLNL